MCQSLHGLDHVRPGTCRDHRADESGGHHARTGACGGEARRARGATVEIPDRQRDRGKDDDGLRLGQDGRTRQRPGEGRCSQHRRHQGPNGRKDEQRVEIPERGGIEEDGRVQHVEGHDPPGGGLADQMADGEVQQQRESDVGQHGRCLDGHQQGQRIRIAAAVGPAVRAPGEPELVERQGGIVDRRLGAVQRDHPALGRGATDAVECRDAVGDGAVAPDLPGGDVARSWKGQGQGAKQHAQDNSGCKREGSFEHTHASYYRTP